MKTTLSYILFLLLASAGIGVQAQNIHFVKNGIIEYEKRSNIYAIMQKQIKPESESYFTQALESYKKNNPQFKIAKSSLNFNKDKSLYTWPTTDEVARNGFFDTALADLKNTIFTNFETQKSVTEKQVFENKYLVTDSLRNITWKITDETREIAGYQCRRANAIIMDSIYVVAFYTNQIAVSGGPESFTGLPGMILGLALPHENVTWFATKVSEIAVPEKNLLPPTKGKPVNNKALIDILKSAMKNWGEWGQQYLQAFSL